MDNCSGCIFVFDFHSRWLCSCEDSCNFWKCIGWDDFCNQWKAIVEGNAMLSLLPSSLDVESDMPFLGF